MINIRSIFPTYPLSSNPTGRIGTYDREQSKSKLKYRRVLLVLVCLCAIAFAPYGSAGAQATITTSSSPNIRKTSQLLDHLKKMSPSNTFLKGQKPVNGLNYFYANWKGKGGIQVFANGEDVKMVSIIAITNAQNLAHLKTPVAIDQLITDLLSKTDAEWYNNSLSKLTSSNKELYSKSRQVALAYDQHVQKLTVTLRVL